MLTVIDRLETAGGRHLRALAVTATIATITGVLISIPLEFGIMLSNGTDQQLGTGPAYPPLLVLDAIVLLGVLSLIAAPRLATRRQPLAVRSYWIALLTFLVVLPGFVAAFALG
jgi:hypothetical protein